MKRGAKIYLVPQTELVRVQVEGTFAASDYEPGEDVVNDGTDIKTDNQIGGEDFEIGEWD